MPIREIIVPYSVDDSTALQKLIDSAGNTAINDFELDGGNCLFQLQEDVSTSILAFR